MSKAPIHAIACNYAVPVKTAVKGALAYVLVTNPGNANDRIRILSRSRGGRWIDRWERIDRLTNFRLKTVPAEQGLLYSLLQYAPDTAEQVYSMQMAEVRERVGRLAGMRPAVFRSGFVAKGTPYGDE